MNTLKMHSNIFVNAVISKTKEGNKKRKRNFISLKRVRKTKLDLSVVY